MRVLYQICLLGVLICFLLPIRIYSIHSVESPRELENPADHVSLGSEGVAAVLDQDHDHSHVHDHDCDHEHSHDHDHSSGYHDHDCDHDHSHDHDHDHGHSHDVSEDEMQFLSDRQREVLREHQEFGDGRFRSWRETLTGKRQVMTGALPYTIGLAFILLVAYQVKHRRRDNRK